MNRRTTALGLLACTITLLSCGGGATPTQPDPTATVTTVSVSAPSTTLLPQETAQLAVVLKDANGATLTGRAVTYSSSAPQTASVSASGLVTAVAAGTTTITAISEGKSGTIDFTVASGTVVGSSGGTVTGGNGAVVLTIPPGALATNTPIAIVPLVGTPPAAPAGVRFNGTAYQIGTAALTFAQPVTIKLTYDAATLPLWVMSGDMVILGSSTSGWTSLSGIVVDTVAKTVSGTTQSIGGGNGGSRTSLGGATAAPLPSSIWQRAAFASSALSAGTPPTVTIAVNPATVTLTPASDSVNPQKRSVMFHGSIVPTGSPVSVPVPGVTSPQPLWRYRWRTTGQNGVFPGGLTDTGWMDVPDIQYICTNANLSVVTGKMDDVILDVLLNPGTENTPAAQQIVRVQGSVFAGLKKTFEIYPDDVTIGAGVAQQLQFLVRDQSGNILPNNPNTRFTWTNTAFAGDLQNGATPDIQVYQAKSTFTSPPPHVDQIDAQIDGVTTVTERSTHWDFSNLLHPQLVVDATTNVTYTLQGTARTFVTVVAPAIQFTIAGTWDPTRTPPNGSYAFPQVVGVRGNSSGLDAVELYFDVASSDSTIGVFFFLFVPPGAAFTAGETFSKGAGATAVAGQFTIILARDLTDPASPNSTQTDPGGTGTCTITSLAKLSDGTFVAYYSFSILNAAGGTISGSGVGTWK